MVNVQGYLIVDTQLNNRAICLATTREQARRAKRWYVDYDKQPQQRYKIYNVKQQKFIR